MADPFAKTRMKKSFLIWCCCVLCMVNIHAQSYVSPFSIQFTNDIANWTADFSQRTSAVTNNSYPAPADWYTADPISRYGPTLPQLYSSSSVPDSNALSWDRGMPVYNVTNNFLAPAGVSQSTYNQQRLLYAASLLIGTSYQHDHLPQFNGGLNPNYQWQPVTTNDYLQTSVELKHNQTSTIANPYKDTYGLATNGIDCTDFAAYVYNLALGIQMHSGTPNQIEFINGGVTNSLLTNGSIPTATVFSSTGEQITPLFFQSTNFGTANLNAPGSLSNVIAQLQPGDLLYMHGVATNISHVVVWLGYYGVNADGTPSDVPLVISSHDNTPAIFNTTQVDPLTGLPLGLVTNGSSNNITDFLPPPGVQILPFDDNTWFYNNFSVAMRVMTVPEPSTYALFGIGAIGTLMALRRKKTARLSDRD
jgi:cell wall-associated NlpC family hydrolase